MTSDEYTEVCVLGVEYILQNFITKEYMNNT